jgi:hypothetical protein
MMMLWWIIFGRQQSHALKHCFNQPSIKMHNLLIGRFNDQPRVWIVTTRKRSSFPGCSSITRPTSQLDGGNRLPWMMTSVPILRLVVPPFHLWRYEAMMAFLLASSGMLLKYGEQLPTTVHTKVFSAGFWYSH